MTSIFIRAASQLPGRARMRERAQASRWRRAATAAAAACMVSAVLPPATPARVLAAGDFAEYSTSNSAFATKVDFVVACTVAHVLRDDPIVFPGQPGSSHSHTFGGNESTDAFSTPLSLARQQTNCKMSRDRAAYWMPTLYSGGKMVTPYAVRAYYRAATFKPSSVRAIPFGLRMIAGDPM